MSASTAPRSEHNKYSGPSTVLFEGMVAGTFQADIGIYTSIPPMTRLCYVFAIRPQVREQEIDECQSLKLEPMFAFRKRSRRRSNLAARASVPTRHCSSLS
jgi:hypothetical protein